MDTVHALLYLNFCPHSVPGIGRPSLERSSRGTHLQNISVESEDLEQGGVSRLRTNRAQGGVGSKFELELSESFQFRSPITRGAGCAAIRCKSDVWR